MTNWLDNLPALDAPPVQSIAPNWFADLAPLVQGEADRDLDDETQDKYSGLDADSSIRWKPTRRTFNDCQHIRFAKDHISRLPDDGEDISMAVSGRYPLWSIVPATLQLSAPAIITDLHIATLSYSRDNADELVTLIDDEQIGNTSMLVSHYFAHANPHLYDPLADALKSRHTDDRPAKMLALRTHSKLILMRLSDGREYVVRSSANLRSCKNFEQVDFAADAGLYAFWRETFKGLFSRAHEIDRHEEEAKREARRQAQQPD